MSALEIEMAVEAARRTGGPFVFLPADATPELAEALTAFAREGGKEILIVPGEGQSARLAREAGERPVPTVAGDDASFLANLEAIAAGKARVQ